MLNLKKMLERYPEGLGPSLSWGGREYYKINNAEPYRLNTTSDGFVLRADGRVQCYSWENHPHDALLMDLEERGESIVWWDEKLESFYPHPWFPDKKILYFECVRSCPGFDNQRVYPVSYESNEIEFDVVSSDLKFLVFIKDILKYPEFFKPVYE